MAAAMLANLDRFRDETGAYWMGMQVEQHVFWPVERPAWTAGAVLLAHDAVHEITPACHVLTARDTMTYRRRNKRREAHRAFPTLETCPNEAPACKSARRSPAISHIGKHIMNSQYAACRNTPRPIAIIGQRGRHGMAAINKHKAEAALQGARRQSRWRCHRHHNIFQSGAVQRVTKRGQRTYRLPSSANHGRDILPRLVSSEPR